MAYWIDLAVKIINTAWTWLNKLYWFRNIYRYTGILFTRKFKKANRFHKYAILVAARNEEVVIGSLVDSIRKQDYPQELVDIFVVADNCTDRTAEKARKYGAICYERFDDVNKTKGFALQFLVKQIEKDYGVDSYEGYFIFDADNLLKHDYITRMNESFDAGEKIITSYRNTKNFDDNWISASYGIHWLRTVRNEHRARSLFHLATRIQGTGFLFASELLKDGWNYTSLTEDRAFCADAVAKGYKISFNNEAEFYDEQPVDMKTAMKQRIRWSKGHLQAFAETGPQLLYHVFVTHGMANKTPDGEPIDNPWWKKLYNNLRLRFMSFDMLTVVFPKSLFSALKKILVYILRVILIVKFQRYVWLSSAPVLFQKIFLAFGFPEIIKNVGPHSGVLEKCLWYAFFVFCWTLWSYIEGILLAAYVYIVEAKRIKKIKWYRKIWFCLTFPIFDIIGRLTMIIALFRHVEWDPISHIRKIKIDEVEEADANDTKKKLSLVEFFCRIFAAIKRFFVKSPKNNKNIETTNNEEESDDESSKKRFILFK